MKEIIRQAIEVFDIEIEAIKGVRDALGDDFVRLVEACCRTLENDGKLIVTGVGKSGYIGQKMAATLSSVGSPAVFLHPVEALHGDLGMMQKNDLVIALSYSGETEELLGVINPAKRFGMPIAAITGNVDSSLAHLADLVVPMPVEREACPFNLAPTSTTSALLVLGDALALVLLRQRNFTREDYGMRHPGGAIGRAVTMLVKDIMRKDERLALVSPDTIVKDALFKMTGARCGSAIVVDEKRKLLGIFTDGDLRRHAEKDLSILNQRISQVMTPDPASINMDALAIEAATLVEKKRINDIIVTDHENAVVGLIDVQDLPSFKLM